MEIVDDTRTERSVAAEGCMESFAAGVLGGLHRYVRAGEEAIYLGEDILRSAGLFEGGMIVVGVFDPAIVVNVLFKDGANVGLLCEDNNSPYVLNRDGDFRAAGVSFSTSSWEDQCISGVFSSVPWI